MMRFTFVFGVGLARQLDIPGATDGVADAISFIYDNIRARVAIK